MTVFGNSGNGKQVFPIDYQSEVSQRLLDASHINDLKSAFECLDDPFVDVNFVGTVSLKAKKTEVLLRDESPHEVLVDYQEFKTDVSALFLAAHTGNLTLVRKLLSVGAYVNQKLFRGYATTAAVREGHLDVLDLLIKCGAFQEACEEALLEASYLGQARLAGLLMSSDLIRPQVAVHALVSACCRGFVNVVDTLIRCGVDANAVDRILLQSSKPWLHAHVDCNALAAAIISRQISVVRLLLKQVSIRVDIKVRLGAWSWDTDTGEEFRVGAGLAEAYLVSWCAVEYFEASGAILQMLLQHVSPNILHLGRTLIHHAILCNNARAAEVLLKHGADKESPIETASRNGWRPVHLAAMLGSAKVLEQLIIAGCSLNSKTDLGETALMICARYKQQECLKILASAGADFGLVNSTGQSASSIATSSRWAIGLQQAVIDVIQAGKNPKSSNISVFSSLTFVIQANDIEALRKLIQLEADLNEQDENGFSAAMIAAAGGHVEAFRLLLYAGANMKLQNKHGETALTLSELNHYDEEIEKILLEYALEEGHNYSAGIHALQETALMLARENGKGKDAENVILDELARQLVSEGSRVKKHTKCGKGSPHFKSLRMVNGTGILQWGKSSKRNVICRGAEVGASIKFRWNRRRKFDVEEPGMFHVMTTKKKEVHFVCEGGVEMAELWVRGIKLVTKEAIFCRKN
ncbi:uncharacterized protein [Euphorbia lathyris]|uniref:uncharacterized protein n=1 Tax=Euphorbia lathyris TaxID=212925 RepID=UPI003313D93E